MHHRKPKRFSARAKASLCSRMLCQSSRQVARAVDTPFNIKRCFLVAVENQMLFERSLNRINSKISQNWGRKSSRTAESGHVCKFGYGCAYRTKIPFRNVPTCFILIPRRVVLQVANKPIGTPDLQAHSRGLARTRRAISSRSCGVHSGCGPFTASTSIFSKVARSPPNSGGATRSNLATSPPRTSSTGEPA